MRKQHKEEIKMDAIKVKLSTGFMRNIVAKLVARNIYKKTGYKIDIQFNDLDISFTDGDTNIKANVEVKLDSKEFGKLIKKAGLD